MEWHATCILHISFLRSLHFICFYSSFPDGARLLWDSRTASWSGLVLWFWMLLKSQRSFPSPSAPSSLEQVEPTGLIVPTASVLGLRTPSITGLCCHQCLAGFSQLENVLQEKLFSYWKGNTWTGTFYIPVTHSTWPPWRLSRREQHALRAAVEARADSLHPAGTLQDHRTTSLAGDGLFVGAAAALAGGRQWVGWPFPGAERECDAWGRWGCFVCLQENSKFMVFRSVNLLVGTAMLQSSWLRTSLASSCLNEKDMVEESEGSGSFLDEVCFSDFRTC